LFEGKDFLHPTFLNLYPTKFLNSENVLYSGYENPKFKIIHYGKVDPEEIIVSGNKIQKQKFHFG